MEANIWLQVWLQTDAGLKSYSSFCKHHKRMDDGRRTDGRNLDPLVSLHLGGLDKNVVILLEVYF